MEERSEPASSHHSQCTSPSRMHTHSRTLVQPPNPPHITLPTSITAHIPSNFPIRPSPTPTARSHRQRRRWHSGARASHVQPSMHSQVVPSLPHTPSLTVTRSPPPPVPHRRPPARCVNADPQAHCVPRCTHTHTLPLEWNHPQRLPAHAAAPTSLCVPVIPLLPFVAVSVTA
jgi:hypothetical protein